MHLNSCCSGVNMKFAVLPSGASVVSHAKLYIWFGTCYAVWHVGKQHSAGDNG